MLNWMRIVDSFGSCGQAYIINCELLTSSNNDFWNPEEMYNYMPLGGSEGLKVVEIAEAIFLCN